jgi:hypothetical protein
VLERIVSQPKLATLVVGSSIVVLQIFILELSKIGNPIGFLKYIIPFIPPYIITNTAKRVNKRRAEYDFIKDAEPFIFVAFPKSSSVADLLSTFPDMISDSAGGYLGTNSDRLLKISVFSKEYSHHDGHLLSLLEFLSKSFQNDGSRGSFMNKEISLINLNTGSKVNFLMSSVLKKSESHLKWQGTLMPVER